MDYSSSKIVDNCQYSSSNALRESYDLNNASKYSNPSQIVDQIRKKYDTPTRRELKEYQSRQSYDRNNMQAMQLKKSINTTVGDNHRWNERPTSTKVYERSPNCKENMVNEEESIFKKIKQMKQSLLNQNQRIRTTKSIYEPRPAERERDARPSVNDTRVVNIDKINMKIQQILSCIKEPQPEGKIGQKEPLPREDSKYKNIMGEKSATKSYCYPKQNEREKERQSRSSYQFSQENKNISESKVAVVYPKPPQKEKETRSSYQFLHDNKPVSQNKIDVRNTNSIYQQDKKYKEHSPNKNIEKFQLSNRGDNSKVRSFISSIQKQTGGVGGVSGPKYEMRSGKKLDDEISKIENKIHQFEEQKRRLNIQFKPYNYSNSKSTVDLTRRSYTIDKLQRPISKFDIAKPVQSTKPLQKFDSNRHTETEKPTEIYKNSEEPQTYAQRVQKAGGYEKYLEKNTSSRMTFDPKQKRTYRQEFLVKNQESTLRSLQTEQENFKIRLIPMEEQKTEYSASRNESRMSDDLRKKTDEGIQDRKKRLSCDQPRRTKPFTKKLVEKFSQQAKLDEKFRNDKLYFECNNQSNKWEQLKNILSQKGVQINLEQMNRVFKITDDENNPFFSVRQSQSSIQFLVNSYMESQQHWKSQIYKKMGNEQLGGEDFSANSLDLQKKGYIVVEDIVRFLNMETGTFYRNRDLFLIFRRVSQQEKIKFEDLINAICK